MSEPGRARGTPLAALLRERICTRGPIPFADFMEACLYHPEHGYYSRAESRRFADYYTSVDVHPVFGRLLACQLVEMWNLLGRPKPFRVVEAGAGTGRLAGQILDFARRAFDEFYAALEYVAVESSPARREAQPAALARHGEAGRAVSAAGLPEAVPAGCILSNELLDALPTHRVVREAGGLREIYVGFIGEEFIEQPGPLSSSALGDYFREQGIELAEGQQAEVCLAACEWIENAGRRLGRGFVLTVDFGHEARELYNDRHMRGTLLAYERHRADEDFFRAPGEQDLAAHVNFTALDLCGRHVGLHRTGLVSQGHYLLALGRANDFADLYRETKSEADKVRARLQFKNLIHPEGMGETFQVLLQHKGVETPRLAGFEPL